MHIRRQIRTAIARQLAGDAGIVAAGLRVHLAKHTPLTTDEHPAVVIRFASEDVEPTSIDTSPRLYRRTASVVLEIVAEAAGESSVDAVDDDLDDYAEAVEAAMGKDETMGNGGPERRTGDGKAGSWPEMGPADDSWLTSSEVEYATDGERTVGCLSLTYLISYTTESQASPDGLADLETVATEYNLSGNQLPADTANDLIEGLSQ
jgi:hypothetical protein